MGRGLFRILSCVLVLSLDGQNADPRKLFEDAMAAQKSGQFASAAQQYQALLKQMPGLVPAWVNLGISLVQLQRFDEAIGSYQQALKLSPGNPAIQANLALALTKAGAFAKAAELLEQLHRSEPGNLRYTLLLANAWVESGKAEDAVGLLAPLESAESKNLDFEFVFASALIRNKNLKDGLSRMEAVAHERGSAEAYLLAGQAAQKLNAFAQARADAAEAVRLEPSLPGAYTLLATATDSAGDHAGAQEILVKALAQDANDVQALLLQGALCYQNRDLVNARASLERAIQIDPRQLTALYELALVAKAAGKFEESVGYLERVERADPNWLPPHVELSSLYFKLHRRADGAREKLIVDTLSAKDPRP